MSSPESEDTRYARRDVADGPFGYTGRWAASQMASASRALPEQLTLRQIKVVVHDPGFRVQSFYIVTTLT